MFGNRIHARIKKKKKSGGACPRDNSVSHGGCIGWGWGGGGPIFYYISNFNKLNFLGARAGVRLKKELSEYP